MRAQLLVNNNGGGELKLRNGAGDIRMKLGTTDEGGVALIMLGRSTEVGAHLATSKAGPSLTLTNPEKAEK